MDAKPLFRTRTAILGLITTAAGIAGASHPPTGAFIRDHAELILGLLGVLSIILRRVTHGKVVLIAKQPDDFTL